jgi:hypothetical protein
MKPATYTYVHRAFITFSVEEYFSIEKQTIKIGTKRKNEVYMNVGLHILLI